ncbi:hypothetical protein C8R45DRAFT_1184420 [Mycena sanguinolenta]|nr:hypothetical protein C8R45DRAFT_1184420 [Mycena sanguinolenta]
MYVHSHTVSNYITGATPEILERPILILCRGHRRRAGGDSHSNSTGGAGGNGMGPSLDISAGNLTLNNFHGTRGIDILHRTVALAAVHDSAENFPQPKCHPETRIEMLKDLPKRALREADGRPDILWLCGPAGAGKSAIMQTLARQLQHAGTLSGCFFFKRGHATRGNGKTLSATIAYQLALWVPWLRTVISQVVENDTSIVIQELVSEPCGAHGDHDPLIILIDGIDECHGSDIQEEILLSVCKSSSKGPIPLRFIVATRPEPLSHIREVFDSPVYLAKFLSLNVEQSFHDVGKYLRDEFSRIHRTHSIVARVPSPWPSFDVLEELFEKSSSHFIYASTVIKFIDDKNYRPTERLAVVQVGRSRKSESPFDALDQLYATILHSTARPSERILILCAIANFDLSAAAIEQLFRLVDGDA